MICVMRLLESRTKGTESPVVLVMPLGVMVRPLPLRSWMDCRLPAAPMV